MKYCLYKLLLVMILVLLMDDSISAQINKKLMGKVYNEDNSLPVAGATINFFELDGGRSYKTSSDTSGIFQIDDLNFANYIIKISCLGFVSIIDTISLRGEGNFKNNGLHYTLKSDTKYLQVVDIEKQIDEKFINFTKGKIILNVQQSALVSGNSAYDILLRAPGVTEQNDKLTFRMKSIKVLINGRPSNLTGAELTNFLGGLPASQLDKVEIIHHPSAKYDSDGGVVVNIILKSNDRTGFNGSVNLAVGSGYHIRHNEGGNFSYGNKKIGVYGAYDYSYKKQYGNSTSRSKFNANSLSILQDSYELGHRSVNNFRTGIDYEINHKIKIGTQFRGTWNRGKVRTENIAISRSEANEQKAFTQGLEDAKTINPYFNGYLDLNLDSLGKKLIFNFDVYNQDRKLNEDILVDGDTFNHIKGKQPSTVNTRSFNLDYTHPMVLGKLEAGIKIQNSATKNIPIWELELNGNWIRDDARTYDFLYNENNFAAYLNWNSIFGPLEFNIGVRAEQMSISNDLRSEHMKNKRKFSYLFPTVNLEYAISSQNVLNFNYRKNLDKFGFQIVNPFKNYVNPYFTSVGNVNIEPQVNHDMELTYTYRGSFVFGVSFTRTNDVISPVYLPSENSGLISTYDNLPNADLFYGFANFPYQIAKWWDLNFSGGYGFYKFNALDISGIASNKSWSYLAQLESHLDLGHSWDFEISAFSRGPYSSGIYRTKGISTVSIGFKKAILKNKLILSANATDIFNSKINTQTMDYRGLVMYTRNKPESRFYTIGAVYNFGSKKYRKKMPQDDRVKEFEKRMYN
ncbi:outer membrane beta-barrel family protein [Sphingobacterium sp.]|uniref:outer membrane beta-barrel family protein n=1 Tax=Sphingobacterium sp. TaxID=341027 RepID=UPI002899D918|nr:outer membrane beta-barrel family protein [Sphingobacterium sp.]